MRLPADPDHPHTGARPAHWLVTAVAVAAFVGAAAMISPTDATATVAPTDGPDAGAARYPVECAGFDTVVTDETSVDLDGDGRAETLAVVRCDAGNGTPPQGVYVLSHPRDPDGEPRVAATLVDAGEGMTVERLRATDGAVSLRLLGYSSAEVPRCCPDQQRDVSWRWEEGRLVGPEAARAPGSV